MKKVALCIGHSRFIGSRRDSGASSVDGTSEWEYNSRLAPIIATRLRDLGCKIHIVDRYEGAGYGTAMRWLAGHLRSLGTDIAIELHFNAATASATGHEWLYWHSSTRGKRLAECLRDEVGPVLETRSRGIMPRTFRDRGAEFLRLTHCPAVIAEPGFGSNFGDWKILTERIDRIGFAYAEAVASYFQ